MWVCGSMIAMSWWPPIKSNFLIFDVREQRLDYCHTTAAELGL